MTTVKARWNGPFVADLGPSHPQLQPGDVYDVSPELLESAHWTAVDGAPAPAAPITPAPTPPKADS